jgi:N-acetylmuramoyl-L-alanine amidase
MRRVLIASLVVASAGIQAGHSRPALRVLSIRHWSLADLTRISVQLTGEVDYRSERLFNPDRLLFDLSDTSPSERGIQITPVGDPVVKQIRIAETRPGVTRIVLDLNSDAPFTVSQLKSPWRLLIEIGRGASKPKLPDTPVLSELPVTPADSGEILSHSSPVPSPVPPPVRGKDREKTAAEKMAEETRRDRDRKKTAPPVTAAPVLVADARIPEKPSLPPALAASPRAGGSNTLIRALGLKMGRVVIDPGHGGHDHGSTGRGGLAEKDLVLDIGKRLGLLLEEKLGVDVTYTRDEDTFITLERRTEIANQKRADLFISIHANSSPYRGASGVETYYLNLSSSREALEIAARENASSQRSIYELNEILQKITVNDKIAESREFATRVQNALHGGITRVYPSAQNRGVKKAPFVVLLGAQMPSILTEIGFVSNPRDETQLKRPETRQKIAESIFSGVKKYAETLSHFQVANKD